MSYAKNTIIHYIMKPNFNVRSVWWGNISNKQMKTLMCRRVLWLYKDTQYSANRQAQPWIFVTHPPIFFSIIFPLVFHCFSIGFPLFPLDACFSIIFSIGSVPRRPRRGGRLFPKWKQFKNKAWADLRGQPTSLALANLTASRSHLLIVWKNQKL